MKYATMTAKVHPTKRLSSLGNETNIGRDPESVLAKTIVKKLARILGSVFRFLV
jgi:hypothetical protein